MQLTAKPGLAAVSADRFLPVAAALIGYALFLFAPQVLNDGDTWWHLTTGQWILHHAAVPHADPFSYTFAGAPWVADEWLSEVLTALACRAGGWDGVLALYGAAAALTFGCFARHLARWTSRRCLLLLLVLGAACTAPSLLARPHLLALPVLELWTAGLLIARSESRAPSVWLLPLMALWANLHGSFAFGLALTAPLALEAVITARPPDRWAALRGWAAFIAAAFAMALLTPNTWHGLLFPLHLLGMKGLAHIGEWQPPDFSRPQPIEFALLALLYATLSRGVRLPLLRLLLVMGLLHLALTHGRHGMLAGIVGALLLAEPLGRAFGQPQTAPPEAARRGIDPAAMALTLGVMLLLTAVRVAHPLVRGDSPTSPVSALAHVPAAVLHTPVFNDYSFGGYLIDRGIPTFIDSRADLFGDRFVAAYARITAPDRQAFQAVVARYGIGWAILQTGSPLAALLEALPGWQRLYGDSIATVFVRRPPP